MPYAQSPAALLMIRPLSFGYNEETASTNAFQQALNDDHIEIQKRAQKEFDDVVIKLNQNDIKAIIISDTKEPVKPDAVFPNNWISTHENGLVITYPMLAVNRRLERRLDVIEKLKEQFVVNEVWDLSSHEDEEKFLEGTGSIVFDHSNKLAYACRSPRTHSDLIKKLCLKIGYELVLFDAIDERGGPIYHTNVMMWIGEKSAVVCLDSIRKEEDQDLILTKLIDTNHKVIAISYQQMNAFAGNMFEVKNSKGEVFILMSQTAFDSLLPGQLNEITKHAEPLIVSINTIEKYGGGGIRCMVAGIYLPEKAK